ETTNTIGLGRALPHHLYRRRLQDALAVELPVVDEHAADPGEIGGGREHPGVAGDAPQMPGPRIVDLAREHAAIGGFGRRGTATLALIGVKGGVANAEGPEHDSGEIVIERLSAHATNDLAEQDEPGVAVLEAGAGGVVERFGRQGSRRPGEATGDGVG